jgi:hypothetical protein
MELFRRLSCADDRPFFGLRSNFDFNRRSSFFSGTEVVRLLFLSIQAPPAIPSKNHLVGADEARSICIALVERDVQWGALSYGHCFYRLLDTGWVFDLRN